MFWNHLTLLLRYSIQFNAIQFSSVGSVLFSSFSSVCSLQFVNKWIHSVVEQFSQGEAAAKINSFTLRSPVDQTGDWYKRRKTPAVQKSLP